MKEEKKKREKEQDSKNRGKSLLVLRPAELVVVLRVVHVEITRMRGKYWGAKSTPWI